MLKNYVLIALRTLMKHRGYSLINLVGLAAGLTCCIIIVLYIREDISYDKFNSKYDRIARVLTVDNAQGVSSQLVGVSYPGLGPALVQELPEVVNSVRIASQGSPQLTYGDKTVKADNAYLTESSFFDIFSFEIIRGQRKGVFDEPRSLVLTESLARRIFGSEDPIGKVLTTGNNNVLHIKALMKDPPASSHLKFDMLLSLRPPDDQPAWAQWLSSWTSISLTNYVLLDRPRDVKALNPKLKEITAKNGGYAYLTPILQPLSDVHLHSATILFEQNADKGESANVYVLIAVGVFILLLACINFMNLVTARSALRAREVGLRKVVGATRGELIAQHLCEAIVVTSLAFILAIGIVEILLPALNSLYGRYAEFDLFTDPLLLGGLLVLLLLVGVLSGSYPAFVLSSFRPSIVLKGSYGTSRRGIALRRVLVVFQFTISIGLIAATGIIVEQMNYIRTKDLGYNREQIVSIPLNGAGVFTRQEALRTELLRNSDIRATATSSQPIGSQLGRIGVEPEGASADENYIVSQLSFDESFAGTLGLDIKAGRNFSREFPADTAHSVLINEQFAAMMNWTDAVGKKIGVEGPPGAPFVQYTVVGVVRDFHFATIRHKVEPLLMFCNRNNGLLSVKISGENIPKTIAFIEQTWKQINPQDVFTYTFLDDDYNESYARELAFASMAGHFTGLAMFIAALGLLGLSAFATQQRRREIGIRKVLGASVQKIAWLLGTDFLLWVALANVVAWPVAYFLMQQWLEAFAYRVEISLWPFMSAALLSVCIAVLTISYQSLRAAFSNPVRALRYE